MMMIISHNSDSSKIDVLQIVEILLPKPQIHVWGSSPR